jgi:hypothetical protein
VAYCRGKMRLAHTWRAKQQDIAALPSPIHFASPYPHTCVSDAHSQPANASSPK